MKRPFFSKSVFVQSETLIVIVVSDRYRGLSIGENYADSDGWNRLRWIGDGRLFC